MQLPILKNATLGDTQATFHAAFPQLKLVFFSKTHQKNKGNNAKFMISNHKRLLGEMPGFRAEGLLIIEPHQRTWGVEKMIEDETGLYAQIFRKSGNLWLATSQSDDLTLAEQTERSLREEKYEQPTVDPIDYREMD